MNPRRTALVRTSLAIAVAAMGLVNVASALLSHPPERLLALRHLVPTHVLDTSRTFTLLAGVLLLVTAAGLRGGKRRSYVLALLLCAVSVPVNLLKALDVEEASLAAALMFALGTGSEAFRVRSADWTWVMWRQRFAVAALALVLYGAAGAAWLASTAGERLSVREAFAEVLYTGFGLGDPVSVVPSDLPPRERRIAEWFARSLPLLGLTLVIGTAVAALRPVRHQNRHRDERDRVQALVAAHGDSSIAAFALEDDCDYFFSPNRRAVLAYRFERDTLLVIGDPIGPPEEHDGLLAAFGTFCAEHDWSFGFFQARPEYRARYERLGWSLLHIGEDPVIACGTFGLEGAAMGDVRRAVARCTREGLEVRHHRPGVAPFEPAGAHRPEFEAMRAISESWASAHGGGERGFCMGRFEPHRLSRAWVALAVDPAAGRVEAFLTWEPVPGRNGWALDLMRRRAEATTGVMEFLVARSVEHARDQGEAMLSLSLSALADVGEGGAPPEPGVEGRSRALLRRHLRRFYDFEGLFRWKRKFSPAFEDRFLVYPDPLALPRVVLALTRAQSPGGLGRWLLSALRPGATPRVKPAPAPAPRESEA